jgi:hypothetical protein
VNFKRKIGASLEVAIFSNVFYHGVCVQMTCVNPGCPWFRAISTWCAREVNFGDESSFGVRFGNEMFRDPAFNESLLVAVRCVGIHVNGCVF